MTPTSDDRQPLTVEDLYDLPDDGMHHELQCGTLLSEPLPSPRHGEILAAVAAHLREHVRRRRLGIVMAGDSGFLLGRSPDTVRGPDVAFLSHRRLEGVDDLTRVFPGAPDLAVEIVSPSNRPAEIHAKVADYLAAGAAMVWLVDPQTEQVTVYRSLLEPRTLELRDELDGEDVVPGFRLPVAELFES